MGGACVVHEEPGKQKPRSCRVQEFGRKQCPRKYAAEKGGLPMSVRSEPGQIENKQQRELLVTQGHDGIDAHRTARGDD